MPLPWAVPAAIASALSVLNVSKLSPAASKMWLHPPIWLRDVEDRHQDHDVDQRVLDEGDERRRAQAAGVGVGRQHHEREEERQVLDEPVVAAGADAHHLEHHLHADQLERDVGHRREDAGDRDRGGQRPAVVAALDEVGGRHVAVPVAHRPEPRQEEEDQRVDHDRVRHREEADHAAGVQRRGDRDERVGGVDVAADQEERDERAEATSAQTPLVEVVHRLGAPPPRGGEAEHGHQQEQEDEDAEGDAVHVVDHRGSPSPLGSGGRPWRVRSVRSAPCASR